MSDGFEIRHGIPHIGDRSFPWAKQTWEDGLERPYGRLGFHLLFESGWTLSVQFGKGNYCANRSWSVNDDEPPEPTSATAEIAAWYRDGPMQDCWQNGDTVIGWCSPKFVLAVIDDLAAGHRPSVSTLAMHPDSTVQA